MLFSRDTLPPGPPIDSKKALLLIDFQNDFVSATGKLPVDNVKPFLPNLVTLASNFRSKGSVIWVRTQFKQTQPVVSSRTGCCNVLLKQSIRGDEVQEVAELDQLCTRVDPEAFLSEQSSFEPRCCLPGSEGAAYPPKIATAIDPKQDLDIVKTDYSVFADPSFLVDLRTRLITHLYICGSLSNISVYATVLDAVMHGLEVTLVEDCLGYRDPECHIEAVRQMADTFGAAGIDYQELMDDLAGLLGDVIDEATFTTRFQVSVPRQPIQSRRSHSPRMSNSSVQDRTTKDNHRDRYSEPPIESSRRYSKILEPQEFIEPDTDDSPPQLKSSEPSLNHDFPDLSAMRKRSPSALDEPTFTSLKSSPLLSPRQLLPAHRPSASTRYKTNRPRVRRPRNSLDSISRPLTPASLRSVCTIPITPADMSDSEPEPSAHAHFCAQTERAVKKKKPNNSSKNVLGPTDVMGAGDCRLITDILPITDASDIFSKLKKSVKWSTMHHRSGEVPRLVAVQGLTSTSNPHSVPIYRHPADESPTLLPFDPDVDILRRCAEKEVGHPLNHALIQLYRTGEDNISEHADKTLDVVRGSSIVNFSLGAQRTMTLRTKRSTSLTDSNASTNTPTDRTTHRVPLPHNSIFVLGQETNQFWLHSIRADKRPSHEKSPAELAFGGERISLTFRHIGTFIDIHANTIWGQGATSKSPETANQILPADTNEGKKAEEDMIVAFGKENHMSGTWDWDEVYGKGFDVVNFKRSDEDDDGGGEEGKVDGNGGDEQAREEKSCEEKMIGGNG